MRRYIGPLSLAVLAGCFAAATQALAQGYPSRPITLLVPAAAGGPTDAVSRMIAESMGRTLNAQVVVENVGGAGGTIGMARVAKAARRRLHASRSGTSRRRPRRRSTTTCATT